MTQVLALFMMISLGVGATTAGKDLFDIIVRMAQVATEKMTMNQIGKSIMMSNISTGRKLTNNELPAFLVKNITAGGTRDVRKDMWGTGYYLEIEKWRGLIFPAGGDDFIVCSAGPDKNWWSTDDEMWSNFQIPDNLLLKPRGGQHESGDQAMAKVLELQKKVSEGLKKVEGMLGLGSGGSTGPTTSTTSGST
ncbi:MAG: hypothetical protein HY303_15275 [Candidatus Wallbacteria bacterium]|nr:hypothetical protein [Candidatus Wallbacteria bacterium]